MVKSPTKKKAMMKMGDFWSRAKPIKKARIQVSTNMRIAAAGFSDSTIRPLQQGRTPFLVSHSLGTLLHVAKTHRSTLFDWFSAQELLQSTIASFL